MDQEYFLLSTDEILAFQAEGEMVWIITAREKYTAALTLRAIEERLFTAGFRRIHRNALVNVESCPQDERPQQPAVADHAQQ